MMTISQEEKIEENKILEQQIWFFVTLFLSKKKCLVKCNFRLEHGVVTKKLGIISWSWYYIRLLYRGRVFFLLLSSKMIECFSIRYWSIDCLTSYVGMAMQISLFAIRHPIWCIKMFIWSIHSQHSLTLLRRHSTINGHQMICVSILEFAREMLKRKWKSSKSVNSNQWIIKVLHTTQPITQASSKNCTAFWPANEENNCNFSNHFYTNNSGCSQFHFHFHVDPFLPLAHSHRHARATASRDKTSNQMSY